MNPYKIENMRADDFEPQVVIAVINKANDKIDEIYKDIMKRQEQNGLDYFSFKESQQILMCNMFHDLLNVSQTIGDLTDCITVGAATYLHDEMNMSEDEIDTLNEEELEKYVKPYLNTQHTFASFNNVEIRRMLFEASKYILTHSEIILIALGL